MTEPPREPRRSYGWAGSIPALLETVAATILKALCDFVPDASPQQVAAWKSSLDVLQGQGAVAVRLHSPTRDHSTVLEYELPREAGRRPDVLVLQNDTVLVLEFKETGRVRRADIDQALAYARDLQGYHSACEVLRVLPFLILCGADAPERDVDGVRVVPAARLGEVLVEIAKASHGDPIRLDDWLAGEYAPLPTLVAAARLLFERQELPFIRRAHSAGVPQTVERILAAAETARTRSERRLVLLTGVPGAGKTLVGLQVAHSAQLDLGVVEVPGRKRGSPSTFLSGNGPLVAVLQNALKSRTFVQDMHRYIRYYGIEHRDRMPPEHLIVFDEAQRAWSRDKVADFYKKRLPGTDPAMFESEPAMLVHAANRIPQWSMVLALVGSGQEIHVGEEAGIEQWADALTQQRADGAWRIAGPPELRPIFESRGLAYDEERLLSLNTTLRTHAAADLHRWVELLLDVGEPGFAEARVLAERLRREAFPIYVVRDLERCRRYARERFGGESLRRYGLMASSRATNLNRHGIDPTYQATKRLNAARWFNDPPESPSSGCQLRDVITEFQAQGLEVDLPITCWGDDFWFADGAWRMRPSRQRMVRDPFRLRTNAYRVLLTRGREGLVIFVPDEPHVEMDATAGALVAAGAISAT